MTSIETRSEHLASGGKVAMCSHTSQVCDTEMRFSVFTPPRAEHGPVPVVYYLAGLTCTEETFMAKAGALRVAAELGLMVVAPDTSPRGVDLPGDEDAWDFGKGAGFYVDATVSPWARHYRMYSYVTEELPALVAARFPARADAQSILGHSMGGHGALVAALRNPGRYRSVSALAPIGAPSRVPWGKKAFTGYLGADPAAWAAYDASALVATAKGGPPLLIDQGTADKFLDAQLRPDLLREACAAAGHPITLRYREGYDHSYYFVSSFIEEHLRFHAAALSP